MSLGWWPIVLGLIGLTAAPAVAVDKSVADLVREVSPQVVRIKIGAAGPPSTKRTAATDECRQEPRGNGSGFVVAMRVNETGPLLTTPPGQSRPGLGQSRQSMGTVTAYILTNNHVANPCPADWPQVKLRVQFGDEPEYEALRVGADPLVDLAVLRVDRAKTILTMATHALGFARGVSVGEDVVAIGFALGQEGSPSVTRGIVSAVGRSVNLGSMSDLVQIDAPIHGGNSGGPLLNRSGEVVGVNTGGFGETVNFAISSRVASRVASELVTRGTVTRGQLGLKFALSITDDVVESQAAGSGPRLERGALVLDLVPGSPLAGAGLRRCDVIQQIETYSIRNLGDLLNAMLWLSPGTTVSVQYRRYPPSVCDPERVGGSQAARLVQMRGLATNHRVTVVLAGSRPTGLPRPR